MTDSEHKWIETNNQVCGLLRMAHDLLACSSLPPRRTWVGLTEEELCEIVGLNTNDSDWNVYKVQEWLRKVEAKLKEKNNG